MTKIEEQPVKNRWSEHHVAGQATVNIAEIERFQGNWEKAARLKPATVSSLSKTSIITSSGASTRIEGAILTDQDVAQLLEKGCKITPLSSRSEREVSGYIIALNSIYAEHRQLALTERLIRELHQLLTENLSEETLPSKQRGAYKDVPNDVVEIDEATGTRTTWFKTTPPGVATELAMRELVDQYNEALKDDIHPLVRIGIFIVRFLAIHPFRDGNGRVSRLLTTLLLIQEYEWCQYVSHEKFIEDSKERYYIALRKCQATFEGDANYDAWLVFFTHIVARQARFLAPKLDTSVATVESDSFSQSELATIALVRELGEPSFAEIAARSQLSKAGLRKLLKRLRDKNTIKLIAHGPSSRYRLVSSDQFRP